MSSGRATTEDTPNTAAEIAAALGGRRNGDGWLAPCPAHDDHDPSLSISDPDGRVLVHCFAGCSQAAVITALRERGLWGASVRPNSRLRYDMAEHSHREPRSRDYREDIAAARRLWFATRPAAGTIVEQHLRFRGITVEIPRTIRFLPNAWHAEGEAAFPAMVCMVQNCSGHFTGVHRTFLANDGLGKAAVSPAKKMRGYCAGGAVRLAPATLVLAITEGIETGFSVLQATRLPTWAALSASGVASLILPPVPIATYVTIFADHDSAGISAAEKLAARLHGEGRLVRIALPPRVGVDFNDILRGAV